MVSEKGLVRAMQEAWRSCGYIVAIRDELIYIKHNAWDLLMPVKLLPRKALALLVEHIGCIPQDGESYQCAKTKGAQLVAPAIAHDNLEQLRRMGCSNGCEKTKLNWGDAEIWQGFGFLEIRGLDPDYTRIVDIEKSVNAFIWEHGVVWVDDAKIRIWGIELPDFVQNVLSSVQWVGGNGRPERNSD
ncbi:MAG: hypothetical protein IKT58_03150 [Oscillospiraceae bacterium]|nr:hypothetical protein [Oscillospiraceae bacterium]